MREGLRLEVQVIERPFTTDPEAPIPILEQREYQRAAQTVWVRRIMYKFLIAVAIKAEKPVLRPEPQKTLVVLYDRSQLG